MKKRYVVIRDCDTTPMVEVAYGPMTDWEVADRLKYNRRQREMLREIWRKPGSFTDRVGTYLIQFTS